MTTAFTSAEEARTAGSKAVTNLDVSAIRDAASWLREHGTDADVIFATYYEGVAFIYQGDAVSALPLMNDVCERATAANDDRMKGNALTALGNIAVMQGDYDTALQWYGESLQLNTSIGNAMGVGLALRQRGGVYLFTGRWPEALEELSRSLAVFEDIGDGVMIGQSLNTLGTLYTNVGDITTAISYHFRALKELEDADCANDVAFTYGEIATAYAMHGEIDRAVEYYHRTLAYYDSINSRRDRIGILGNIGLIYLNNDRAEEALPYLKRSCEQAEEVGAQHPLAFFTEAYANALLALGQADACRGVLDEHADIFQRYPDVAMLVDVLRAKLVLHDGDAATARTMLENSLRNMAQPSMTQYRLPVHELLQTIAKQQMDFEGYLSHEGAIKAIREEREGKETTQKIAFQEKQREMEGMVREHQKHMQILHNTLPKHVADRVARGEVVNDHYDNATVIFLDLVGFTDLSSRISSQELIALLDDIFTQCDAICAQYGVTKIKTIGDAYMAVSFDSVTNAVDCALAMSHAVSRATTRETSRETSREVSFRIGMHTGPLIAGVIGTERLQYDVWGDTVNVASRMESSGEAGRIQVSAAFAQKLATEEQIENREYRIEERGEIEVKGKGKMTTYWLIGGINDQESRS